MDGGWQLSSGPQSGVRRAVPPRPSERRVAPERREPQPGVGRRVQEARKRVGLSGADLGKLLDLDKTQISKIESETRKITPQEMPKLARALRVTPQWLLGMKSAPQLALAHRLAGGGVGQAQARASEVLNVEALLEGNGGVAAPAASAAGHEVLKQLRSEIRAAPRTRAEAQRQGRQMAELVREGLKLGQGEIGDLPELMEANFAADVVLSPMGTDVDGLCAHSADRVVIVASSSFDRGHVRFTLSHELGHHLAADPRPVIDEAQVEPAAGSLVERRVSAFAAHLLLPREGVVAHLAAREVTKDDFVARSPKAVRAALSLAGRFGASVPATVYQLQEFGFVADVDGWVDLLETSGAVTAAVEELRSVSGEVRAPRRLLDAALDAAVARRTGTGPLAVLLERDDEDAIYAEYIAGADELAGR